MDWNKRFATKVFCIKAQAFIQALNKVLLDFSKKSKTIKNTWFDMSIIQNSVVAAQQMDRNESKLFKLDTKMSHVNLSGIKNTSSTYQL